MRAFSGWLHEDEFGPRRCEKTAALRAHIKLIRSSHASFHYWFCFVLLAWDAYNVPWVIACTNPKPKLFSIDFRFQPTNSRNIGSWVFSAVSPADQKRPIFEQ